MQLGGKMIRYKILDLYVKKFRGNSQSELAPVEDYNGASIINKENLRDGLTSLRGIRKRYGKKIIFLTIWK